jgi:hypothetical protein
MLEVPSNMEIRQNHNFIMSMLTNEIRASPTDALYRPRGIKTSDIARAGQNVALQQAR